MLMDKHLDKLGLARVIAKNRLPRLSAIMYSLSFVPGDQQFMLDLNEMEIQCPPDLVDEWSIEELATMVAHEALHLFRGDAYYGEKFNTEKWFVAADVSINCYLRTLGFTIPVGSLVPEKYDLPLGKDTFTYYLSL